MSGDHVLSYFKYPRRSNYKHGYNFKSLGVFEEESMLKDVFKTFVADSSLIAAGMKNLDTYKEKLQEALASHKVSADVSFLSAP
jgi:hypothetical protein